MALNQDELRSKYSEEVQELKRQLREKEEYINNYRGDHGKLEVFFSRVMDEIRPIEPAQIVFKPKSKPGSQVTAVMQVSDGHMGAVQVPDEIEGLNEFDPEICTLRQMDYTERFLHWVEMHRQAYQINRLAVLVTGDLISGDIHQELQTTNAFPAPVQVVRAAEVLAQQIAAISPHFEQVDIHFITEDNHARLTKKPQAKEAGLNSFNYLVGYIAQSLVSKHENVNFNLYPMYEKVVHVGGRQYLISHGHGLVGWMGIPWYSINRHVGKEATNRMQVIMSDINRARDIGFHKYIFGHWHTPFDHPLYSCCGSISGTDAYDHKQGRYSPPSQSSWLVHPKHGEFDRINFML